MTKEQLVNRMSSDLGQELVDEWYAYVTVDENLNQVKHMDKDEFIKLVIDKVVPKAILKFKKFV